MAARRRYAWWRHRNHCLFKASSILYSKVQLAFVSWKCEVNEKRCNYHSNNPPPPPQHTHTHTHTTHTQSLSIIVLHRLNIATKLHWKRFCEYVFDANSKFCHCDVDTVRRETILHLRLAWRCLIKEYQFSQVNFRTCLTYKSLIYTTWEVVFTVLALQSNRKVVFDYFLGVWCFVFICFLIVVVVERQTAKGCKTT